MKGATGAFVQVLHGHAASLSGEELNQSNGDVRKHIEEDWTHITPPGTSSHCAGSALLSRLSPTFLLIPKCRYYISIFLLEDFKAPEVEKENTTNRFIRDRTCVSKILLRYLWFSASSNTPGYSPH